MTNLLDFDLLKNDNATRKLIENSFYNAKADEIFLNMQSILSSREKDREAFRWRYAINLALISEVDLIKHMIEKFASNFDGSKKSKIELDKMNEELRQYCDFYNEKLKEKEFFENQNKEIIGYDIDFCDIDVDFDKMAQVYKSSSQEFKEDFLRNFNLNARRYNIEIPQKQPTGSSMGE